MFSKNRELERHTEPVAEEIGELSDEQLEAVVGGLKPCEPQYPKVTCSFCSEEQPYGFTGDTCIFCGRSLSSGS